MTLLLVFVGCVFTVYALWLTFSPFLGGSGVAMRLEHLDEEVRRIELLVAQREVVVGALRELEFDHETDKISVEDYEKFRKRYEHQAVLIMRELDEIHGGRDWQQRVDDELAERLGHVSRLSPVAVDAAADGGREPEPDELPETVEPQDEEEPGVEPPLAGPRCASCSEPLEPDDKFCSQCGTPTSIHDEHPDDVPTNEASA